MTIFVTFAGRMSHEVTFFVSHVVFFPAFGESPIVGGKSIAAQDPIINHTCLPDTWGNAWQSHSGPISAPPLGIRQYCDKGTVFNKIVNHQSNSMEINYIYFPA
jgi:hypothetical protein